MKRPTLATLLAAALVSPALAADHADGPAAASDPTADIADLYAWMTPDGAKLNLVLTVATNAVDTPLFSDAVTYAFHVNSMSAYGEAATETLITCSFYSQDGIECWVGDSYVEGDPTTPITSSDGKVRVYADQRNDPFFFNLDGFTETVSTVIDAAGDLSFDDDSCPLLDGKTASALVTQLAASPSGGDPEDAFAGTDVLAIVMQLDKTLVNSGGDVLGIWASTHAAN